VRRVLPFLLAPLVALSPLPASAWTPPLVEALNRDARKLLPRSLRRLLSNREQAVLDEARRFPAAAAQALAQDARDGRLRPETVALLDAETAEVADLLKKQRVTEGLARLGALLRIPAELSDPVRSMGGDGYPAGVTREYYAFVEAHLPKIPVVLDDEKALGLDRRALPAYWQALLDRSRSQSPVIRVEMFRNGKVVDHRLIDYRNPVYGVASLSYSRAVTGIAATWLAVWRDAHGDTTRIPKPKEVVPRQGTPPAPSSR
jgi:hypothetical protein